MLKNDQKFGKKIENITYSSFCVLQVSIAIHRKTRQLFAKDWPSRPTTSPVVRK